MDLKLAGKRAAILGGSRGIGRSIAHTLAAEGAAVAICARNAEQVAAEVAALKAAGATATGASVDITDGEALKAWIDSVAAELGGLDILVSNAGAMAQGADAAGWTQNFQLDVLGLVNAYEAAKPHLLAAAKASGDASVVIISSISAAESDAPSSYGPIKAALIHYAKGVARQNAGAGLRCNVVSPGNIYFDGGVWQQIEKGMPDFFKAQLARNPTGRMGTPQEIADAAVFLASPLSAYTSGVNLIVDGAISRRVNF
jgi:3-oxoacyl-[acyl-carrier protein] reductase